MEKMKKRRGRRGYTSSRPKKRLIRQYCAAERKYNFPCNLVGRHKKLGGNSKTECLKLHRFPITYTSGELQ